MTDNNKVATATRASSTSVRPCAFCQVETGSPRTHRSSHPGLQVRCLLNPGRAFGPDGAEISLTACTPQRQAECQTQRRREFAHLCATLPALRRLAL